MSLVSHGLYNAPQLPVFGVSGEGRDHEAAEGLGWSGRIIDREVHGDYRILGLAVVAGDEVFYYGHLRDLPTVVPAAAGPQVDLVAAGGEFGEDLPDSGPEGAAGDEGALYVEEDVQETI